VLVVGPIAGGSLGVARSVAHAVAESGAESRYFDAAAFAGAQTAFGGLSIGADRRAALKGQFALLLGNAVVAVATEWQPDLVIALAQAPLTEPALMSLRQLGIPTAFWFVENVRVLPYWRDVCRFYDFVYVIQPTAVDRIGESGAARVAYLPMACDPRVHRRVILTDAERVLYGGPLSFAGAPYLNRRHILTAVSDLGLKVWGDRWESTALAAAVGAEGRFDIDAMLRIFSGTDVNLNVHSADHVTGLDPDPDYVNPRTFELAACGAFQLVDRRDPLPALFDDSEAVAFGDVKEMRALCTHYLQRPDERAAIAAHAEQRALAEHTYDRRVARIMADALPAHLFPASSRPAIVSLDVAIAAVSQGDALSREEAMLRIVADVRDTVASR
jgi:spore maturation protein CgeB